MVRITVTTDETGRCSHSSNGNKGSIGTGGSVAADFLDALRSYLRNQPLDFHGEADSLIGYLFQYYDEVDPVPEEKSGELYKRCVEAFQKLVHDRDAALGVKTEEVPQESVNGREFPPFILEVDRHMELVDAYAGAYGRDAFRNGLMAGARLVLELMGEDV